MSFKKFAASDVILKNNYHFGYKVKDAVARVIISVYSILIYNMLMWLRIDKLVFISFLTPLKYILYYTKILLGFICKNRTYTYTI